MPAIGPQQAVVAGVLAAAAGYAAWTTFRQDAETRAAVQEHEEVQRRLEETRAMNAAADRGAQAAAARRRRAQKTARSPESDAFRALQDLLVDALAALRTEIEAKSLSQLQLLHVPIVSGLPPPDFVTLFALLLLGEPRLLRMAEAGLVPSVLRPGDLFDSFGCALRCLDRTAALSVWGMLGRLTATPLLPRLSLKMLPAGSADAVRADGAISLLAEAEPGAVLRLIQFAWRIVAAEHSGSTEPPTGGEWFAWARPLPRGEVRQLRGAVLVPADTGRIVDDPPPRHLATAAVELQAEAFESHVAAFVTVAAWLGIHAVPLRELEFGVIEQAAKGPASLRRHMLPDCRVLASSRFAGGAYMPKSAHLMTGAGPAFGPNTVLLATWDVGRRGLSVPCTRTGDNRVKYSVIGNAPGEARPLMSTAQSGPGRDRLEIREAGHLAIPPLPLTTEERDRRANELAARLAARRLGADLRRRVGGVAGLTGSTLEHAQVYTGMMEMLPGAEAAARRGRIPAGRRMDGATDGEAADTSDTGAELDLVQGLKAEAAGALAGRDTAIVAEKLRSSLLATVPAPAGVADAAAALEAEVSAFVTDLLQVLSLRAASVPLDGARRTPLAACPASDARDAAWDGILVPVGSPAMLRLAVAEIQHRTEAESLRAQTLSGCTAGAVVAALLVLFVLFAAGMFMIMPTISMMPAALQLIVSVASTASAGKMLLCRLAGQPAHSILTGGSDNFKRRIAIPLVNAWSRLTGRPPAVIDPTAVRALQARCEATVRTWGLRRLKERLSREAERSSLPAADVPSLADELDAMLLDPAAVSAAAAAGPTLTAAQAAAEGVACTHHDAGGGAGAEANTSGSSAGTRPTPTPSRRFAVVEGPVSADVAAALQAVLNLPLDEAAAAGASGGAGVGASQTARQQQRSQPQAFSLANIISGALGADAAGPASASSAAAKKLAAISDVAHVFLAAASGPSGVHGDDHHDADADDDDDNLNSDGNDDDEDNDGDGVNVGFVAGDGKSALRHTTGGTHWQAERAAARRPLAGVETRAARLSAATTGTTSGSGVSSERALQHETTASGSANRALQRGELPRGDGRRRVADALREHGFSLVRRSGGHYVYRKIFQVAAQDGTPVRVHTAQVTLASTPSDVRAGRNDLAKVRRAVDTGMAAMAQAAAAAAAASRGAGMIADGPVGGDGMGTGRGPAAPGQPARLKSRR